MVHVVRTGTVLMGARAVMLMPASREESKRSAKLCKTNVASRDPHDYVKPSATFSDVSYRNLSFVYLVL